MADYTIDFMDSCSWCNTNADSVSTNAPGLKYDHISGSGARASFFLGPEGQGTYFFSSTVGNVVFRKILSTQTYRRNSFSLNVINARNSESNIWTWATPSGCVASVSLGPDGKLRIYLGGDGLTTFGTLMYASNTVLAINQWYSIDVDWYFPSTGAGTASLYINDVLDTNNPGHPSVPSALWGNVPDRFTIVWTNNSSTGIGMCDILTAHGADSQNSGPVRVAFIPFIQDQLTQWLVTYVGTPQPGNVGAIYEYPGHLPDGVAAPNLDFNYISTATGGAEDLFGTGSVPCYAKILGLALNACLEDPSTGQVDMIVRPVPFNGLDVIIGGFVSPTNYGVLQSITQTNNGATWTDGDIGNAWWGIFCVSGTPRCTQLFLEKATTLRAVPYSCGQLGSYCV